MLVYVQNIDKQPLMPTSPAKARILLKIGRAKVVHTTPFTIRLTYVVANHVQPLTHGVDTGSTTIGSAVTDNDENVVYTAEVQLRNDIAKKMERRKEYRRNRRNRKTRYRRPKWAKLKARKDKDTGTWKKPGRPRKSWLSPTMVSKFHAHQKEIALVSSILPIAKLVLETGTFDPHALKNPAVLTNPTLYQLGINYGFANTKPTSLTGTTTPARIAVASRKTNCLTSTISSSKRTAGRTKRRTLSFSAKPATLISTMGSSR